MNRHSLLKSISCFFVAVLIFSGSAYAGEKLFLWEVQSKRPGSASVFLLGTMHVWKQSDYPLPEAIEQALKRARVLAVEVDTANPQTQQRMMERAFYGPEDSLERHLPSDVLSETKAALKALGLDAGPLAQAKPWLLGSLLISTAAGKVGYRADLGIDTYLMQKAMNQGKRIVELESADFQIDVMESLTPAEQVLFVKEAIQLLRGNKIRQTFDDFVAAWNRGDTAQMDRLLRAELKNDPLAESFYKRLFEDRNPAMAEKIIRLSEGFDPVLVAVGAGHLVGRGSVIEALTARGYVVKQLSR